MGSSTRNEEAKVEEVKKSVKQGHHSVHGRPSIPIRIWPCTAKYSVVLALMLSLRVYIESMAAREPVKQTQNFEWRGM